MSERAAVAVEADDAAAFHAALSEIPAEKQPAFLRCGAGWGDRCLAEWIERGLDVSLRVNGQTLVYLAAHGCPSILAALISAGAPLTGVPLVRATKNGCLDSVRLLLDAGAFVDQGNPGTRDRACVRLRRDRTTPTRSRGAA